MAVKEFDARIGNKRDTDENWETYNPVLLDGEIIIVDTANGEVRKKVGDGVKKYTELPFDDEYVIGLINEVGGGSTAVNATLLASDWVSGQQTLNVEGVTADTNGIIGVTQTISTSEMEAVKSAELYVCAQGEGTVTIAAYGDTPTCDIPVVVILIG